MFMKRNWKKMIALTLVLVLSATTLSACKKNDKNEETTTGTKNENGSEETKNEGSTDEANNTSTGYTDYSNGFTNNVTIQIPVYDRAFEGWDVVNNYYTQWIQKNFGDKYNVTVEYVAIGRSTEVADYMQLLAAGKAPDIIYHYDMPQAVNYYNEGAMQALDVEEIAYYAPTYYNNMKDTMSEYGQLDGQNVFFFAARNAIYYNWVTLIRQDWLDAVNKDMPTNLDELNAVAAAWKDAGLGTLGGSLLTKSFTYDYPFRGESVDPKELALYSDLNVAPLTWESSEAYLKNLNYEYNNGLIDPEFYLKSEDADVKAAFVAGKTGTYSFYISSSTDVISSLLANNPDAKLSVLSGTAGVPEGSHPYYYQYPPYGMIMGMNSKSTAEERAAVWMFLEWMSQKENLFFLQNGVEGENYNLDEYGIAVPVADFAGESKRSNNNNKDYWCLVQEVVDYGNDDLNYKANLTSLAPAGYEYLVEESYNYAKETAQYGLINAIFSKTIESTSEYAADLNALWQELYVDLATCSPEEFDSKYEAACQEYLDAGYQEILDEKQALIDAGN